MSAEELDDGFSAEYITPTHLTTTPKSRIAPGLEVNAVKGLFYCVDCRRRVTRNSENDREYGHDVKCEHHETSGFEPMDRGHFADGGAE